MNSKKASPKVSKVTSSIPTPVVEATEYEASTFISRARRSGSSTKASTVKANGLYTIPNEYRGTATVLRSIYETAFKGKKTVPAPEFGAVLNALFTGKFPEVDKETEKRIKALEAITGRSYGNLKTLRRLIRGDIRVGATTAFTLSELPARS